MEANSEDKLICSRCIGERYLKAQVLKEGEHATCDYCKREGKSLSIKDLAENHIRGAFDRHYERTPLGPPDNDWTEERGMTFPWNRPGDLAAEAIADAAGLQDDPAEDVRAVLQEGTYIAPDDYFDRVDDDEDDFAEESHYQPIAADATVLHHEWRRFQETLKTETRLFNSGAERALNTIFAGLGMRATRRGGSVIASAGPGEKIDALYRARVFQSDLKLQNALKRPDLELSAPPAHLATAGRMNARGISVFYGATHPEVAIAETRPPVGSHVLAARFELIRPLSLLDLQALRSILVKGSIFDPSYLERLRITAFLSTLGDQITKPVMPNDEPFDYIVTQAIADYLANLVDPKLDGIIYRSVQHGKSRNNVVLFQKSARVKPIDMPRGTIISAYTMQNDDGISKYRVSELWPKQGAECEEFSDFPEEDRAMADMRQATLELDISSLRLHHIRRAAYSSKVFTPTRERRQDGEGGVYRHKGLSFTGR